MFKKSTVLLLLAIVIGGCGNATEDVAQKDQFTVLATIYPLLYFTEQIAGPEADVQGIIGSGADAHTFEPSPADIRLIASADLIVANGMGFEPWLGRAIASLETNEIAVVETAFVDEGHEEGHDAGGDGGHEHVHEDPHFWLDPVLAAMQVERIRDALIAANPDRSSIYVSNAASLLEDLATLHADYTFRLADCSRRTFITTHAAYGYMAGRYDLEQLSISGLSPEAEPTPRQLADLVVKVRDLGLTHILVESVGSTTLVNTLATETNIASLPIHPLESASTDELVKHRDYFGLMRDNLDSLSESLGCVA